MPDCSWTSSSPVCDGTAVVFDGPSGMDSYNWDFGDGAASSAQDASHLYSAPGTYTVSLNATKDSCSKSCMGSVIVEPQPDCSWTSNAPVCDDIVRFNGPAGMDTYQWDFGDGDSSPLEDPIHRYRKPGTYTVRLTVTSCGISKTCTKKVEVKPPLNCRWTSNAPVCEGMPVHFNGPAGMDSYQWDFGDGSESQEEDPVYLYSAPGTYTVMLAVKAGDSSESCTGSVVVRSQTDCGRTSNAPAPNGTAAQLSVPMGTDPSRGELGDGQAGPPEDRVRIYPG